MAVLRGMVKPMKEYIMPSRNYEYILTDAREALEPHAKQWIEIPKGAEQATLCGTFIAFWKHGAAIFIGDDTDWDYDYNLDCQEYLKTTKDCGSKIIWQRPTQPEALPFIDDNPQSLNEQYAEIEGVRQAIKVKSGRESDHMADAMSYGFMGGIDATLAERQSTYGNFEDVAFVTENIMSVLGHVRVNGLSELPDTHRMALYMIASKMARIVNGDFNHIDSWHDIGGYAKLVEDLIKENSNG